MTSSQRLAPGGGNLKQRAIACALQRLERLGETGLGLREIADELGAGVGSLYYYFANKDALLAELAIEGFRELGRWMAMAAENPPGERTTFNAAGHAYLGFTRHRPALYELMYSQRLLASHASVRRAEAEAFEVYCASLQGLGVDPEQQPDVAYAFWALGRGIATATAASDEPGADKAVPQRVIRGLEVLVGRPIEVLAMRPRTAA